MFLPEVVDFHGKTIIRTLSVSSLIASKLYVEIYRVVHRLIEKTVLYTVVYSTVQINMNRIFKTPNPGSTIDFSKIFSFESQYKAKLNYSHIIR